MTTRVAINGFGRIGRTVLRAAMTRGDWPDIEIVAINDISDAESCAYLFEYDSIFGPYPGAVTLGDGRIEVDGRAIRLSHAADLAGVDLSDVDVVMECTGRADDSAVARAGLHAGARRVLISGPSAAAELTVVIGANEETLTPRHLVVSNASCTTNALAPLARLLHARWGIESGFMTTIHCYTGSQPTLAPCRSMNTPSSRPAARSRATSSPAMRS